MHLGLVYSQTMRRLEVGLVLLCPMRVEEGLSDLIRDGLQSYTPR